jgi:hypothetical protein
MADEGISALQKAGSVAAIVGASVAVVLLLAGIARWWWRNHRVWSVKPRIFERGDEIMLGVKGVPASFTEVTAFVDYGKGKRSLGTGANVSEILFRLGRRPHFDESIMKYKITVFATSFQGDKRRIFKKKVRAPWSS